MTAQSDAILTALQQIRAQSAAEVAPQLEPMIKAVAAWSAARAATPPPAGLATTAGRLAEVAADAGDARTAVTLAGLRADLESLAAAPAGPVAALRPPADEAESAKPLPVDGASLVRRYPIPLLLGLIAASALSYGVHVAAQVRIPLGSLTGWLLSASTTLLAVALSLRVGALLARRLPPRPLMQISAATAVLAVILAGTSYIVHQPVALTAISPQSLAGNALSTAPKTPRAGGAAPGTPGEADAAGVIALWWLGSASVTGRELASPVPLTGTNPESNQKTGPEPDPAIHGSQGESSSATAPVATPGAATPPDAVTAMPANHLAGLGERYTELLDQPVRLIDTRGEAHDGTLAGVSKEGVTLLTQVMMFSEPIQAHRQFPYGNIRTVRPR